MILNVLAIGWAFWFGRYRRDKRARDVFFGGISVFNGRTCPQCGIKLPGSPIDIHAHALTHSV